MPGSGPPEISPQVGLVCFAFGAAQVQPGDAIAGPVLLRLLADLGVSGPAARSLLLRMRREGWLTSERAGRQARYRLAPVLFAGQDRVERQLRGDRPAWNGSFSGVLYTVPERFRPYRDRLRRSALLLGYVTLRPGLLVATTDRYDELVALLPADWPAPGLSFAIGRAFAVFVPLVSNYLDAFATTSRARAGAAISPRRASVS